MIGSIKLKMVKGGTITDLKLNAKQEILTIEILLDNNKKVIFDPEKYQQFNYGYACTVHKAQGLTIKRSFVFISGWWNKSLSYVAMTRHKESVKAYGSLEDYQDLASLKKSLAREGTKDSVLDYPLSVIKQNTLKKVFQRIVNPKKHFEQEKILANKVAETLNRRQDATIVASYVDANQAIAKILQGLNLNENLTLKDLPDVQLKPFKEALEQRDELAFELCKAPQKYQKALEIYGLNLDELLKQSTKHQQRETVKSYMQELQAGRMVHINKLAARILQDIKVYYPIIIENKIDLAQLKVNANRHARAMLLKDLPLKVRQNFKIVEEYVQVARDAGMLWK